MNLLTVIIITYNQELYIEKALDSVMSQETDFNFIVKVFDDCSTDGAQEIIKKYAAKYPQKIEAFFNEKNLGGFGNGNVLKAMSSVDTKYFSILDGDDYWCDDNKLQTQLELMEKNPNLIGCGHNSYLMKDGKTKDDDLVLGKDFKKASIASIVDVIEGRMYTHSSSIIYRSAPLNQKENPSLYEIKQKHKSLGDFFNMMFFAQYGDIAYVDKVMSVYRIHQNGIWSKIKNDEERVALNIDAMLLYKNLINKKYSSNFSVAIYYGIQNFLKNLEGKKSFLIKKIKYKILAKSIKSDALELPTDLRYGLIKKFYFFCYKFMLMIGV